MKYVLSICGMLAFSLTAYGQQAGNRDQTAVRQTIAAGTQIDIQLRILEVSLTKLRRLGFDLTKLPCDSDPMPNPDQPNGNAQAFSVLNDGSKACLVLDALRHDNLAKVLAEPMLATRSGKTTVFNLGEKLAVPKRLPDGSMTIEQQHATVIKVTPEVSGDKVHLAFHGRFTELDHEHSMRVGKKTVPGVRLREFTTRAELKSGQTLTIRGLTQTRVETINRGVPYVSEIPYVGAVLRRVEEERNDVAMFVLVRPEIVPSPAATTAADMGSQGVSTPDTATPATARRIPDDGTQR